MTDRYRQPGGMRAAAAPEPFWRRIRAIALYPLHGAALWSLIALTLCGLLAMLPAVGWIIGIVTWLAIYRYAFEILRHTANGHAKSPEHTLEAGDGTVLRLVLLTILLFVPVVATALVTRSKSLTLLVGLAVVMLQPGCVISLAIDGSLRRALNPMVPLAMATRIGWPYLAAFGLLFVIQASAATADHWLDTYLPPVISHLAASAVSIWGLFATFHLLGYLVYQYHEQLGFEPEADGRPDRHDPDQPLLAEAEAQVAAGDLGQAMRTLRAAVRTRAVGLPVHEIYHRLLRQAGPADELREHARQYLSRLMGERQERRALALAREMLDQQPDFTPAQQEHAIDLVERARLAGQFRLCTDLLLAMCAQWPRASQAPQWSLDAAMLLAERFGEDAQARGLLERALGLDGDEEQNRRLQAALKALSQSSATPIDAS
jgi:hypothetical protein